MNIIYDIKKRSMDASTAASECETARKEIVAVLTSEYKQAMLNAQHGIPFIQNKTDIPLNCFISAEAVWWCIEHVDECACEADAIVLMQVLADFDVVRHISDHHQKIFIHGFYLYYIITDEAIRSHHVFTKVGFVSMLKPLSRVRKFFYYIIVVSIFVYSSSYHTNINWCFFLLCYALSHPTTASSFFVALANRHFCVIDYYINKCVYTSNSGKYNLIFSLLTESMVLNQAV